MKPTAEEQVLGPALENLLVQLIKTPEGVQVVEAVMFGFGYEKSHTQKLAEAKQLIEQ